MNALVADASRRYLPAVLGYYSWQHVRNGYRCRWWLAVQVVALVAILAGSRVNAADPPILPRYDLDLRFDTSNHRATLRQVVSWTNTTHTPTNQLTFNFYPHYSVPKKDYIKLAKTLEMLRLQPSLGIDRGEHHGEVLSGRLLAMGGKSVDVPLAFFYDPDNVTAVRFTLPGEVKPGESVTMEMVCDITLPNKQGRLGYYEGVSFLTNSTPLLAYCDDSGWRPMPFVPWHQPWFNEAGEFHVSVTLPENEVLAVPATVKRELKLPDGWKTVETNTFVGRDFAILASTRFKEYTTVAATSDGRSVPVRCLAFPEHEFYAREVIRIAAEAIPVYSTWFGPYPSEQLTFVESFFGWNGNECAGLIMIDERVFNMPHLVSGYAEYLVSHETCHQWWYNLIGTNGYAETFMDEGAATYFAHRLLDQKLGKNNDFLNWPDGFKWMPSLKRESYRYSGMYTAIRNHEMFPAAQPLPEYGSLFGLFTGAYDRGSKIFGMIEDQLGEAAYFDFLRALTAKYAWRMLQVADFRRELEAYTGRDWGDFFNRWVYGKGMTDWAVEHVEVRAADGTRVTRWDRLRERILCEAPRHRPSIQRPSSFTRRVRTSSRRWWTSRRVNRGSRELRCGCRWAVRIRSNSPNFRGACRRRAMDSGRSMWRCRSRPTRSRSTPSAASSTRSRSTTRGSPMRTCASRRARRCWMKRR